MEVGKYDLTCIMPVYNTEKYVKESLLSVLKQEGSLKLQILVVDDGSTDSSVLIIKKLQTIYPNIELFQQKNAGPAVARNLALRKAQGKYIIFVDSDDLLPINAIEKLYLSIESNNSEIATGMFEAFNSKRRWKHESMSSFIDVQRDVCNLKSFPELINNMSPWNKIYLTSFIRQNKLEFLEGVSLREDIYFVTNALFRAQKISIIPDIVYFYRSRGKYETSLTTNIHEKVFQDIFTVSNRLDADQKVSSYAANTKVWSYRYTNELDALVYRLWPFIQAYDDGDNVLFSLKGYLCKLDNKTVLSTAIDKRIILDLIKKGEFIQAKKLIKAAQIKENSLFVKIKNKLYNNLKELLWKVVLLSKPFLFHSKKVPKNLWLIGERHGNGVNDTGYRFFLYCRKCFPQKAIYFVTKKENITDEIKNNNIITYGSLQNFLYAINAQAYIFSDSYKDIIPNWFRIKDFSRLEVSVFLQHGVFALKRSDYYKSTEVAKRDESFDIFIVASEREKKYVAHDLGYDEKILAVTGFSRFDKLYESKDSEIEKKILFIPTWRSDLRYADETTYLQSKFHAQVLAFTNSSLLKKVLIKHGYHLEVYFHHAASKLTKYYHSNNLVTYSDMTQVDISKKIINAPMLITDYSSIAFDLAYINRPVAFYQFDVEEFLLIEGGSFINYETDLFGVVSDNPEEIIIEMEYNIVNDFKVKEKYQKKVNSFFRFKDNKNSQRIFKTIETHIQTKILNDIQ